MDHKQARAIAAEIGPELLIEEGMSPYIDVRRHQGGPFLRIPLPQDLPGNRLSIEARRNIVSEAVKSAYQYLPDPPPPPPDPAEVEAARAAMEKKLATEAKQAKVDQEAMVQEMVKREIANKEAEFMRLMSAPRLPPEGSPFVTVAEDEDGDEEKPKSRKKK